VHYYLSNDSFICNLDLTEELNFIRLCAQEKRNLGYCGLITLLSLHAEKSSEGMDSKVTISPSCCKTTFDTEENELQSESDGGKEHTAQT